MFYRTQDIIYHFCDACGNGGDVTKKWVLEQIADAEERGRIENEE